MEGSEPVQRIGITSYLWWRNGGAKLDAVSLFAKKQDEDWRSSKQLLRPIRYIERRVFCLGPSFHEYEIRVLRPEGGAALIMAEVHLTDKAAIRAGKKMADGRKFEVWRGMECIYGIPAAPEQP